MSDRRIAASPREGFIAAISARRDSLLVSNLSLPLKYSLVVVAVVVRAVMVEYKRFYGCTRRPP